MTFRRALTFVAFASVLLYRSAFAVQTEMVAMRDGTKLATDCYFPTGDGPFPVILSRSPYPKASGIAFGAIFNKGGIAYVIQDTRGRGASEGKDSVFGDDGWGTCQDGVDTGEWIKKQKWCNGKLGTFGASALAITQSLMAAAGEPLTCQVSWVGPSNFYGQLSYEGGVFIKSLCEKWTEGQKSAYILDTWKAHPTYDAFWDGYNMDKRVAKVTCPNLMVGGWWDIFARGEINQFVNRQHDGGPGAKGNQYLIMGPWGHGGAAGSLGNKFGDLKMKPNQGLDINKPSVDFLKLWLTGDPSKAPKTAAVRYYTVGDAEDDTAPGSEWRESADWPPFPTTIASYYLHANKHLDLTAPAESNATLAYTYDPSNPCPTKGGPNLTIPMGSFDQREKLTRADVLAFETAPLDKPIEITGQVAVRLFVSTSAPDTDFTGMLVDIYPDGRAFNMLDSIQRLKFRHGFEKAEPLAAGKVDSVDINLGTISLVVNKGHKIGLYVSSSNFPRFEINPNTGADFPTAGGELRKAENKIFLDKEHASALLLPIRNEEPKK